MQAASLAETVCARTHGKARPAQAPSQKCHARWSCSLTLECRSTKRPVLIRAPAAPAAAAPSDCWPAGHDLIPTLDRGGRETDEALAAAPVHNAAGRWRRRSALSDRAARLPSSSEGPGLEVCSFMTPAGLPGKTVMEKGAGRSHAGCWRRAGGATGLRNTRSGSRLHRTPPGCGPARPPGTLSLAVERGSGLSTSARSDRL